MSHARSGRRSRELAGRNAGKRSDAEVDLHGLTVEEMRLVLQKRWPEWRTRQTVRIIHGRGGSLKPALEDWLRERGIPFYPEPNNPGSVLISPLDRTLPQTSMQVTLAEKGLRLTPEEISSLRDPAALERARLEERQRREAEASLRRAAETTQAARRRRDEALWEAEIRRLDSLDQRHRAGGDADDKPAGPRVLPPSVLKHQEGYWRAELVRVADTDEPTLLKQKRAGLEKLAPPLEPSAPKQAGSARNEAPATSPNPEADRLLFEQEMDRLASESPHQTTKKR